MADAQQLLREYGLTGQEAQIYIALCTNGQGTGYELAKQTGISRSNAYGALGSLVEKGGAYLIEGKPVRYEPVPVGEFCRNTLRRLQGAASELETLLAPSGEAEGAYLTIRGGENIHGKIHTMIAETRLRIYLAMPGAALAEFLPGLAALAQEGRKVVVITDEGVELPGAKVYRAGLAPDLIRVISDSTVALTGSLDSTCLFSRRENLVSLLKDSIKNEIRLLKQAAKK